MLARSVPLLFLLLLVTPAWAYKPAEPCSYARTSPGGKYLLVVLAPFSVEAEAARLRPEDANKIRELRRKYPRAGLYCNDGGVEPLWTIDWYAFEGQLYLKDDGVHVIKCDTRSSLCFYAKGQAVRAYSLRDLMDDVPPTRNDGSGPPLLAQHAALTGEFEFTVQTMDGNVFTFDIRTGDILTERRWSKAIQFLTRNGVALFFGGAVLVILVFVAGIYIIQMFSQARRQTHDISDR